ncbi:glycine zipper 2TM domain-containing protein [Orbus wheelerorum]|uniref:glycine zipper 2TM domain-containing protein n=1 Tax=Orbus wheelerorum TaxID=3074111 RepID=UPI00370DCDD3
MKKITVLACLTILLVGCQNSDIYSGNVYTANQAKQVQNVSYGTVLSVRAVKIQTNASNDSSNSIIGTIGGAILGGFLGNTIGGGAGNKLATAGGAIGGAIVGSEIENAVSQTNAVELEIRQANGSSIVIVQKAEQGEFQVGQQVRLVTNGKQVNASPR